MMEIEITEAQRKQYQEKDKEGWLRASKAGWLSLEELYEVAFANGVRSTVKTNMLNLALKKIMASEVIP